jgi:hypothetical protein
MNWYVATTVEWMNYAPPYAIGKDSIMAIISSLFQGLYALCATVLQSWSRPIRLLPVWFFVKKKSLWGYYYTYGKALQNTPTKVENTLKNNHAFSKVIVKFCEIFACPTGK